MPPLRRWGPGARPGATPVHPSTRGATADVAVGPGAPIPLRGLWAGVAAFAEDGGPTAVEADQGRGLVGPVPSRARSHPDQRCRRRAGHQLGHRPHGRDRRRYPAPHRPPGTARRRRGRRRRRARLATHPQGRQVRDRDHRPHPDPGRHRPRPAAGPGRGSLEEGVQDLAGGSDRPVPGPGRHRGDGRLHRPQDRRRRSRPRRHRRDGPLPRGRVGRRQAERHPTTRPT